MAHFRRHLGVCLGFLLGSAALLAEAQTVIRGPYLQQGGDTSITVRWRTNSSTNSRVRYGTVQGSLALTADVAASTTNHEVRINGLAAETTYWYSVGTTTQTLAGNDVNTFFKMSPAPGAVRPTRIWVLGDAGTQDANQRAVRDAYYTFTGSTHTNLWLMLGDNAYNDGADTEYQAAIFDMYPTMLKKSVLWSAIGNHDGGSGHAPGVDPATGLPYYYSIHTFPKNAEAGGLASGTEAYYSFDYANIHFMSLDSQGSSRAVNGPMHTWAKNDAAATTREWIVAFWHHPPYSKGSHDSDSEGALIDMRKNFLPILEDAGVDLVLSGHSHAYERTFLIDGHYGISGTFTNAMKKNGGSGRDPNPYTKSAGTQAHEGTVYVVAGSSGKISGGPLNHPAMYVSLNNLGSMVLDVSGGRLDAKFLRENGVVADSFTLLKTGTPPPGGDTVNPTVTINSPTNASTWTATSNVVALGGSATDNVGVSQVTWSNAAGGTGTASGTTSWTANVPLSPGSNVVTVTARDAAGNTATDVITITYTPPSGDSTPPTIAIQLPTTASTTSSATEPVLVSGIAADNVGLASVTWTNAATGDSGSVTGTTSWSVSVDLATGANLITVTARDAAGNVALDTLTVTYTPPAPPPGGGGPAATSAGGTEGLLGDHCALGSLGAAPTAPGFAAVLAFLALLLTRRR